MSLQMQNNNQVATVDTKILEQVLANGDLSKLTSEQRLSYYHGICNSLGLNPYTRPFDYITLNSKLTLYVKKDGTEQLRKINGVSVIKLEKETMPGGIYVVTAHVQAKDGRVDISTGAVNTAGLKADALANAYMKAETKAKRRATLSLCGLGMLDESEIETLKDAKPYVETEAVNHDPLEPKQLPQLMDINLDDMAESIKTAGSLEELKELWATFNKSTLKKDPNAVAYLTQEKEVWMINNGYGDAT